MYEDLSDRALLLNYDAHRMTGVEVDGIAYAKQEGETPLAFITRVREEASARRASEEAKKANEERRNRVVLESSHRGQESKRTSSRIDEFVQEKQESLVSSLSNQERNLSLTLKQLTAKRELLNDQLNKVVEEISKVTKEVILARKFIKELTSGCDTPENNNKMGGHLDAEVGVGQGGGDSLGEPNDTTGVHKGGKKGSK
jgi:hypothetical protein